MILFSIDTFEPIRKFVIENPKPGYETHLAYSMALRHLSGEIRLGPKPLELLVYVGQRFNRDGGPVDSEEIDSVLKIASPPTNQKHLEYLVKSGFVTKKPNPDNARHTDYNLTKKGQKLIPKVDRYMQLAVNARPDSPSSIDTYLAHSKAFRQISGRIGERIGLIPESFELLEYMGRRYSQDKPWVKFIEIERVLDLGSSATARKYLKNLVKSGFVTKKPNPHDKRSLIYNITEEGHEILREIDKFLLSAVKAELDSSSK